MVGEISERIVVARRSAVSADLKARVASGVVLAVGALSLCYLGSVSFAVLVAGIAGIICWEWARIVRRGHAGWLWWVHAGFVEAAIVSSQADLMPWALGILVAGAAVLAVLAKAGRSWGGAVLSGFGSFYVGVPAVALIWLRGDADFGFLAVLFLFATVWTTDTFAYVCGTLIRGPKLWPSVSPNKTWAGLIGGIVFAGLAGTLFAWFVMDTPGLKLTLVGLLLSACAQAGDLGESALKRHYGVKNASNLIPGHGGFLDRMDGIIAATSAAALLAVSVAATTPARALLFW